MNLEYKEHPDDTTERTSYSHEIIGPDQINKSSYEEHHFGITEMSENIYRNLNVVSKTLKIMYTHSTSFGPSLRILPWLQLPLRILSFFCIFSCVRLSRVGFILVSMNILFRHSQKSKSKSNMDICFILFKHRNHPLWDMINRREVLNNPVIVFEPPCKFSFMDPHIVCDYYYSYQ